MNQVNGHLVPRPSLILFDMDDTLVLVNPKFGEFICQQIATLGFEIDPERSAETERWLLYHWMQPVRGGNDPQVNEPPKQKKGDTFWYEHLLLHLRILGLPKESIQSVARDLLGPISTYQADIALAPDAISILESLSEAGYRLGLLSNRLGPIHEVAESTGIAHYFELISCGGEMGLLKPDPRFFHYALDWFDMLPGQAVYIGDNYYADVVGAKFAGLTPILVDPKNIFPNSGCLTIKTLSELPTLLTAAHKS